MMRATRSLAITTTLYLTVLLQSGCLAPPPTVEPDCEGAECAARTIQALVPAGAQINFASRKDFVSPDQNISFTLVGYGQLQDCPSGCFSSVLCAIEDPTGVRLYFAAWDDAAERPLDLQTDCPE